MPQVIEIADLSAPELEVYARLTEGQLKTGPSRKKDSLSPRARR